MKGFNGLIEELDIKSRAAQNTIIALLEKKYANSTVMLDAYELQQNSDCPEATSESTTDPIDIEEEAKLLKDKNILEAGLYIVDVLRKHAQLPPLELDVAYTYEINDQLNKVNIKSAWLKQAHARFFHVIGNAYKEGNTVVGGWNQYLNKLYAALIAVMQDVNINIMKHMVKRAENKLRKREKKVSDFPDKTYEIKDLKSKKEKLQEEVSLLEAKLFILEVLKEKNIFDENLLVEELHKMRFIGSMRFDYSVDQITHNSRLKLNNLKQAKVELIELFLNRFTNLSGQLIAVSNTIKQKKNELEVLSKQISQANKFLVLKGKVESQQVRVNKRKAALEDLEEKYAENKLEREKNAVIPLVQAETGIPQSIDQSKQQLHEYQATKGSPTGNIESTDYAVICVENILLRQRHMQAELDIKRSTVTDKTKPLNDAYLLTMRGLGLQGVGKALPEKVVESYIEDRSKEHEGLTMVAKIWGEWNDLAAKRQRLLQGNSNYNLSLHARDVAKQIQNFTGSSKKADISPDTKELILKLRDSLIEQYTSIKQFQFQCSYYCHNQEEYVDKKMLYMIADFLGISKKKINKLSDILRLVKNKQSDMTDYQKTLYSMLENFVKKELNIGQFCDQLKKFFEDNQKSFLDSISIFNFNLKKWWKFYNFSGFKEAWIDKASRQTAALMTNLFDDKQQEVETWIKDFMGQNEPKPETLTQKISNQTNSDKVAIILKGLFASQDKQTTVEQRLEKMTTSCLTKLAPAV